MIKNHENFSSRMPKYREQRKLIHKNKSTQLIVTDINFFLFHNRYTWYLIENPYSMLKSNTG